MIPRPLQPYLKSLRSRFDAWTGKVIEPPQITLSETILAARRADHERARARAEIADMRALVSKMADSITDRDYVEDQQRADYIRRAHELVEAKQMAGSGPWLVAESRGRVNEPGPVNLKESNPLLSQGAYGDMELALQNINWRREINQSWLEFSRWGIQQVILISRLYYIKNPIIRRLIDIAAQYVFARGVEVSSPDPDANDVLQQFFEKNRATLGQIALTQHERTKYTDGNLFFVFFADRENTGEVICKTIDATEVMDIICNPNDADVPWYYRRSWTVRRFDEKTGTVSTSSDDAWYPAISYNPIERPDMIGQIRVLWDSPIYHRKCGAIAKWHFGCPLIYPALDWAREARRFLESCASVMAALSQIAIKITTKGGQQALEGIKQQLQTTIGPTSPLWDQNPPAVAGATFGSGPGTSYEAMKTQGAGQDPERVREYKRMCCMTVGVPESFLSAMDTGNLATATSLDRPTELVFLERQEAWREDLVAIAKFVLSVSATATRGLLREALAERAINPEGIIYREVARRQLPNGRMIYVEEAAGSKRKRLGPPAIEVKCTFPAIREGDIPELIKAVATAMTLDNKGGMVVGIDEKAGVGMMFEYLGYENGAELTELMYPDDSYDPERDEEVLPPPIEKTKATGGPIKTPGQVDNQRDVEPQPSQQEPPPAPPGKTLVRAHHRTLPSSVKEAIARLLAGLELKEAMVNGELEELVTHLDEPVNSKGKSARKNGKSAK